MSRNTNTDFDISKFQPGLPEINGHPSSALLESLVSLSIDGAKSGELRGYATCDFNRFLRTLDLMPAGATGRSLEIGANPYFNTLLFRAFRPGIETALTNYFGGEVHQAKQNLSFTDFGGQRKTFDVEYTNCNIEEHRLPFADAAFDWIVFCEVLEHMTNDPLRSLKELKRVLKPGGQLILTTPNAARIENMMAFIEGRNIYDPYSGYGPYGRHNREYTRHELHLLMEHCGFECEVSYTANVHSDLPWSIDQSLVRQIVDATPNRCYDLGQYFFTRWNNKSPGEAKRPRWLYRSYPETEFE
jgi:SAM-dependent methyltransferase